MTKKEMIAELQTLIRSGTHKEFATARDVIFGSEHNPRDIYADSARSNLEKCTDDYVELIHRLVRKKLHRGGTHVYATTSQARKLPRCMSDMQREDIGL